MWAFIAGYAFTSPIWWFYLYWLSKNHTQRFDVNRLNLGLPLVVIYTVTSLGNVSGGCFPLGCHGSAGQPSSRCFARALSWQRWAGGRNPLGPTASGWCQLKPAFAAKSLSENVAAGILACRKGRHLAARKNRPPVATLAFHHPLPAGDAVPPGWKPRLYVSQDGRRYHFQTGS